MKVMGSLKGLNSVGPNYKHWTRLGASGNGQLKKIYK